MAETMIIVLLSFAHRLGYLGKDAYESTMEKETMSKTLTKVKNLEQFISKHGDDALISQTIVKMLSYKIRQYQMEIRKLDRELRQFERAHSMDSSDFLMAFTEGKLGDDLDFIEWSALYQMRQRLLDKKAELEKV